MAQTTERHVDISEEELSIFGLTSAEAKIVLGLIERGPMNVSRISRVTDLPHTTVHSAIRRLREQGLVRRISKGYSSVWRVVKPQKIRKKFNKALSPLEEGVSRETLEDGLGFPVSESAEFFVFRGKDEILKTYQWFFLNHRNERVCGIQTTRSAQTIYGKLEPEIVAQLNDLVKMNRVIVDAVLAENIKDFYRKNLENRRALESIEGGTASVHLIPDEFLDFNADLIVSKQAAFLANWDKEVLLLVKDKDFIELLQNLFEFIRSAGRLFDQDTFICNLLGKKSVA